ncbi:glycosyltransferase family 4 protein [Bacillus cereus]|uniref:Glycosyltransferase subfamily 4-like N-terminal domain-containing protein n=1 Tax=Bacillus cereus VD184 TaxID=1053242 RepID=A0A9W5VS12_BACCE|nr:glycosyltransferase family 4 protein [Bacillus cereus]EOQ11112.1 hypothetical protein IKC_05711 [Bacillus cereus VD184]
MKILVITQYYYPEIGAASKRLTELTQLWNQKGHDVHVYTSLPNYPQKAVYKGYENKKKIVENLEGITVYRNHAAIGGKDSKLNRIKTYLSFMINACKNANHLANDYDVVITSTGPIFSGLIGYYISKRKKIPNILEFRDITFKSLEATGYTNPIVIYLTKKLELFLSRQAKQVVTVTETYRENLVSNGIDFKKISVIPNGYAIKNNDCEIDRHGIENILRTILDEKQKNKKIIGYFGTLGISQGIEHLVDKVRNLNGYSFFIIGEGAKKVHIEKLAIHTDNVFVFDAVTQQQIECLYDKVDFNLIKILNSKAFSGTIPSKLFEIIGNNGIPIYIGPEGDAQKIICTMHSNLYHKEIDSLLKFLEQAPTTEMDFKQIQETGKRILIETYDRQQHAGLYLELMNKIK